MSSHSRYQTERNITGAVRDPGQKVRPSVLEFPPAALREKPAFGVSAETKMVRVPASPSKYEPSIRPAIPNTLNLTLASLVILLNIFQLTILPVYYLPKSIWWSVILIPIAALNNSFWALIHEAIHDLFHSAHRVNVAVGRCLSIVFGSPFHILRLTHLSHHKFNRSPLEKGTEIYNPEKESRFKASIGYFFYILCGLYLLEVFSTLIFFLPPTIFRKMRQRLVNQGNIQEKWLAGKFMDDQLVREIRIDGLAICLIFGLSAFCYGEHWKLLMGLLVGRMFLISFLDNVYHYRTPLYRTISGHNLSLPRVFSTLLLNFNLHRVHHTHPTVPWTKLPEVFTRHSESFDRTFVSAALDQFCGPLPSSYLADPSALIKIIRQKNGCEGREQKKQSSEVT